MASATLKPAAEMSGSAGFSYAQAAKGRAASLSTQQPAPPSGPNPASSNAKEETTAAAPPAAALSATPVDDVNDISKSFHRDAEDVARRRELEGTSTTDSSVSVVSAQEGSMSSLHDEETSSTGPRKSLELKSAALAVDHNGQVLEGADDKSHLRAKKTIRNPAETEVYQEPAQQEKEISKPILSEAPIPSVNIWHKRIEAQAATKPKPTSAQNVAAAHPAEEPRKKSVPEPASADPPAAASNEKPQRKAFDPTRAADQPTRRISSRGNRVAEREAKSATEALPPVADSALWPTPESAAGSTESKRRTQDKGDRVERETQEDSAPTTKRNKPEWKVVDFVPTVSFQTMPHRGSRGRGGTSRQGSGSARGGHNSHGANANAAANAAHTGDKQTADAGNGNGRAAEGTSRDARAHPPRANSLPPASSKRASVDGSYSRKSYAPTNTEQGPEGAMGAATKGKQDSQNSSWYGARGAEFQNSTQGGISRDGAPKGFDHKDDGDSDEKRLERFERPGRERGEGRSERGRGQYRGNRGGYSGSAGGHASQPAYSQPNGIYTSPPNRQSGPYSPQPHQTGFGTQYQSAPQRGTGRPHRGSGSSRQDFYPRTNGSNTKVAPIQTANLPFDQWHGQPFTPYYQQTPVYDASLIQLLMLQMEYYLSVDNLCKDFFIRRKMDTQGFVPFSMLAGFNRMRELAPDVQSIRLACESSDKIDFVMGDDGAERLRLREKWDSFVLPMEERDPDARTDGPTTYFYRSRHSRQQVTPYQPDPLLASGYPTASPSLYSSTFPTDDQIYTAGVPNGTRLEHGLNGDIENHPGPDTQLSATVPDFAPTALAERDILERATTYPDEQVKGLKLAITPGKKQVTEAHSGITVNGSAEFGTSLKHSQPNGVTENVESVSEVSTSAAPPIFSDYDARRDYLDILDRAVDLRQHVKPGETPMEVKLLYDFWSHFLIDKFNSKMYQTFRLFAIDDATSPTPSKVGLLQLMTYYRHLMSPQSATPWLSTQGLYDILSRDQEHAIKIWSDLEEPSSPPDRPA